ncbi:MAG TPA: hypothetical protein VGI75_16315, partial [Pirellulales bacterium]
MFFIVRFIAPIVWAAGRAQIILRRRGVIARKVFCCLMWLMLGLMMLAGRAAFAQVATPPVSGLATVEPGMRHVQILPRSDLTQIQSFPNAATGERIVVVTGGVTILIDGLPTRTGPFTFSGSLDVTADRVVIWTTDAQLEAGQSTQPSNAPLEMYMEGNIVFREGDRILQSKAMYYNVQQYNGVSLDSELLAAVPLHQGIARLKAEVLRQVDRNRFVADNASVTTSRLGIPTYEFKSGTLTFDDEQTPALNPLTGEPQLDAAGQPIFNHEQLVTGQNNVILVDSVPVFYWPFFAADLERPPLYVESVTYRHDNVFGNQFLLNLNPYEILGIRQKPKGTNWIVSLDYLSDRGFGGGTKFDYDRQGLFDWPGRYHGFVDAWYIDDHGHDNLGLDRRDITFPNAFRGRTLFRHEQELPDDWQARLEVGEITDRNFLQEYYQQEWEE